MSSSFILEKMDYTKLKSDARVLLRPIVNLYLKTGLSPNFLTLSSLGLSLITAYLYKIGQFRYAALMLIFSGLCDTLDGDVARRLHKVSKFGAFLDSVVDRYTESIIFFGILLYYIKTYVFILAFFCLIGSFMVSYTRARAEGLGEDCKVGICQRTERFTLLLIGSLFGPHIFVYFLWAIMILTNFTAVYRIYYVWKRKI